jgi:uncharacterized protein DUF2851
MREDLLHFIWKYKKLQLNEMITSNNETLVIVDVGIHNRVAGPDFFNAKIKIGGQLWAGNVEIHINSSDWYVHHHEQDSNYDNVILHVVWKDDMVIHRKDKTTIPTLELKKYIPRNILSNYQKLFENRGAKFINCEKEIAGASGLGFNNWLERLYIERLEQKTIFIEELLVSSKNDWEKVLFTMLLKNFGLKINGDSFLSLANALDFSIVRKLQKHSLQLESVLFGLTGLLEDDSIFDTYYLALGKEYKHQKNKFSLTDEGVLKPEFFKLRPSNFPTIRLAQFAKVYTLHHNLFSALINASNLTEIYNLFGATANSYWDNHFTFGKQSRKSIKRLTKRFIDLLVINTILPIKFSYAKHLGKEIDSEILHIINHIKKEENGIVKNFGLAGVDITSAKESQAVLQLYREYCTKNKCLQCSVGSSLLSRNN